MGIERTRVGAFIRRPAFWAGIAMIGAIYAITAGFINNGRLIDRNHEAIQRSNRTIEYLCETNQTLDLLVKQFIATGLRTLPTLHGKAKLNYMAQVSALQAAHLVLSDTRACKDVTG